MILLIIPIIFGELKNSMILEKNCKKFSEMLLGRVWLVTKLHRSPPQL